MYAVDNTYCHYCHNQLIMNCAVRVYAVLFNHTTTTASLLYFVVLIFTVYIGVKCVVLNVVDALWKSPLLLLSLQLSLLLFVFNVKWGVGGWGGSP